MFVGEVARGWGLVFVLPLFCWTLVEGSRLLTDGFCGYQSDGCAAGVVSAKISSGRRMCESVLCGFETKDMQDTIWPHSVVSVLWTFDFALSGTSPNSKAAVVRARVNGPISWEQVRTKTCD